MTTVINTPGNSTNDSSGVAMIVGILVAVALVALFFMYVSPQLRATDEQKDTDMNINVKIPSTQDTTVPTP